MEWRIRQFSCPFTLPHNIASIAHDQYTDIYPLLNIYRANWIKGVFHSDSHEIRPSRLQDKGLLTSYPRSGNSFLRNLLEQSTGIITGSDSRVSLDTGVRGGLLLYSGGVSPMTSILISTLKHTYLYLCSPTAR